MTERSRDVHPPAAPRWVKVLAVVVLVVALALAVVLLGGGGDHGPARHALPVSVGLLGAPSLEGSV